MKRYISILMMVLLVCSCKTTMVNKDVVQNAKVRGMEDAKKIAVIGTSYTSRKNREYSPLVLNKLESFLSHANLNGKPLFQMVDRARINEILKEQKMSNQQHFDDETAAELGGLVGADTLMTAHFSISSSGIERYKGTENYCKKHKESNSKLSKLMSGFSEPVMKCEEYGTREITCTKKTVGVELVPKATSVVTGTIRYSADYSENAESKKCPTDKNKSLATDKELVNIALAKIFIKMRKDIGPYTLRLNIELLEDDAGMTNDIASKFESAVQLANNGLFDRSCSIFEKISAKAKDAPALIYNMGVCNEMHGDIDVAKAYYEKSLSYISTMSTSDAKVVMKAIKRLEGKLDLDTHNKPSNKFADMVTDFVSF